MLTALSDNGDTDGSRCCKTCWQCQAGYEKFCLSCKDAQVRNQWRMRSREQPVNLGLPGKMAIKMCQSVHNQLINQIINQSTNRNILIYYAIVINTIRNKQ